MRLSVLALVIALTGCVSQNQPGAMNGDDFDMEQAAKTRISLGLTYLKNGNYQQAKVNLDKALEFAPRYADAHYSLAYYYQTVEEWERAEDSYDDAMTLAPRNAEIANSYGAFLCQRKQYDKAETFFQKALDNLQYAGSAETYENMAICALQEGRTDAAIKYLNSALNHQPGRTQSLFMLADLYVKTAQWEKAEATMRRYERVSRVSPESIQLAIAIAEGLGDKDTAEGYGEMLVTMYPQSEAALAYRSEVIKRANQEAQVVRRVKPKPTPSEKTAKALVPANQPAVAPAQAKVSAEQPAVASSRQSPQNSGSENGVRYHVVQRGENLYRISLIYNLKMARIQEWNDLADPGDIEVGMRLRLSPRQ
ncbi:type IV pilus biogenesis/stability protein PilW [Alteromonas confluentis]|uniref:Type IV pilus biogenesis/stability protein PilW n=1 Tax=Alteromonas confluentis TaxID=1656094 RepID=A0A1E7ZAZ6_9ALTE|nr:type IV pilus biogenesis/stability protein PilW [Alteromonas confluentis]OFC70641.1 type IV pilus biogenesis/stability protein PilW [Alteromonas confluentis]